MLSSEDVAYLLALIEKSPSTYRRRKEVMADLQAAWKASQSHGQPWNMPITATLRIDAGAL